MNITPFPNPDWRPKPNDEAVNIDVRVLVRDQHLLIAELRFAPHARFQAHDAPWDCHVLCMEGSGFVRVGDDISPFRAGEAVVWPSCVIHQLWTEESSMVTQMVEHVHQADDPIQAWREHLKVQQRE